MVSENPPASPTTRHTSASPLPFVPPAVQSLADTGLPILWLQDLVLKIIYFQGYITGFKVAEAAMLPFTGVMDQILESLKRDKLLEVRTSPMALGEGSYIYAITDAGTIRAREALERCQYAGPAPVPLAAYTQACQRQKRRRLAINEKIAHQVFSNLVLSEKAIRHLGPAINSGTSIFLYGPSGDGKTSVARMIGNLMLSQSIYIPYALYTDGQVIKLYDSFNHKLVPEEDTLTGTGILRLGTRRDIRWMHIYRPFIEVGGELTLAGLDLVFDDVLKYYEAPFQVKANGGVLLIDDFGRQQVRPRDLLNRWIVPLESRIDFLNLHTGRKLEMPFDVMVIFSTNLPPKELADEAFLRRLRHKVEIGDPQADEYRQIFQRVAASKGVTYSEEGLAHLLQEWYIKHHRKLRASHARDLCDHILDIAQYLSVEPAMTPELIDQAAETYFVDL